MARPRNSKGQFTVQNKEEKNVTRATLKHFAKEKKYETSW
jgi:hypothetical protein